MEPDLRIETKKFDQNEIATIKNSIPQIGNVLDLEIYNESNYFQIKRIYSEDILVGYAVIFLGYNGLESNDISLEDLVYWGEVKDFNHIIGATLELLKDVTTYPFMINEIYFDETKFAEIGLILEMLEYKAMGRAR